MQVAQVIKYIAMSKDTAVVFAQRTKGGQLVDIFATGEAPESLPKGHSFGQFTATADEQQAIDMVLALVPAPVEVKADPMVNRLKKSEIEKPVAFVLRFVQANPTMTRKDLIAELVNTYGVATYTARTQVQVGLKRRADLKARADMVAAQQAEAKAEADAKAEAALLATGTEEPEGEPEGEESNYE